MKDILRKLLVLKVMSDYEGIADFEGFIGKSIF